MNTIGHNNIEEYRLSLNVLANSHANNIMRIKKGFQGEYLIILIDSGNIHNFIDELVIIGMKAIILKTMVLEVIVANDNVMLCDAKSLGFTWFT